MHPASLQYKPSQQQIFIVDYRTRSFLRGGTEIVGKRHAEIFRTSAALACITVVGRDFIGTPGLLNMLTERLAKMKITIFGVSVSENYMGLYVNERLADTAHEAIFREIDRQPKFSAVSVLKGIGRLRLSSTAFIEQPGIIGRIGDLLAMKGINIIEMITIQTDITIFLHRDDLNKAYALLKKFSF
jgi:aspartate kinase